MSQINPPSKEEIDELLHYLTRINQKEQKITSQIYALIHCVWALLFFYAGIIDFIIIRSEFNKWSFIPWFLTSIGGAILTLLLATKNRHTFITKQAKEVSTNQRMVQKSILLLIILSWPLLTMLTVFFNYQLILIVVCFMTGSSYLFFLRLKNSDIPSKINKFFRFFIFDVNWFICYLATVLMIVINIKFEGIAFLWFGLIFGISNGVASSLAAVSITRLTQQKS
jgi:hypothetical protein